MKLTKQIGKNVLVCMLALTSMTGMVFASGSNEVSTSPIISGNSWAGVIDGIAIDIAYDESEGALAGTVTSLLQTDVSNAVISIDTAQGDNIVSLTLGTPGDLAFFDTTIKEDTTIFAGFSSVPVMFYLNESQGDDLFTNGWKVSFDSDNAPRYGLFEKGELLATNATHLFDSFVINENGIQTVVNYRYEDEGFSGTVTNYTNMTINEIETCIALNNGTVFESVANDIQAGETKSFFFGAGASGFSKYAVETIIN